jgi:electron transfer flavoprotein alpha subunit
MILVILETQQGKIMKAAQSAVTAAFEAKSVFGLSKVKAVIIGGDRSDAALETAIKLGCDEVLSLSGDAIQNYTAVGYSAAVQKIAADEQATFIVIPATSRGKDFAPRVAAGLEAGQASDCLKILPGGKFLRPMYAGNILAEVEITTAHKVITVRGTAFEAAPADKAACAISEISLSLEALPKTEIVSFESVKSERPELSEAQRVVSGGRALKSAEAFQSVLTPLADALGAALGASRAAVDSGYAPNDWQVGQTGKVVAPQLYISVGISGAIQHLAGMKDSKVVVAINKDPEAPIFEVADYGLVADLFEVVPQLTEKILQLKK